MTNFDFTKQRSYVLSSGFIARPKYKHNKGANTIHCRVTCLPTKCGITKKPIPAKTWDESYSVKFLRAFTIGLLEDSKAFLQDFTTEKLV